MPGLIIGSVPRGEDYFGQEELIDRIWSHLEKNHVLLTAPRRSGKTGAMYHVLDFPRKGYKPIYIDVESSFSAAEFVIELLAVLLKEHYLLELAKRTWKKTKKFGAFLRNIPAGIELGGLMFEIREKTDAPEHWLDYAEKIKTLLSKSSKSLLLIIDEFPIMINEIIKRDAEEAKKLLYWFRSLRNAPDCPVRFLIGGSINLVSTLDRRGLVDTIDDIAIIKVLPFTEETAGRYIEIIFSSHHIESTGQIKETILELVGEAMPYFLAVFLQAIIDRTVVTGKPPTPPLVREIFHEDLISGSFSVSLKHYYSRVAQYYPDQEARAAKEILGILSRAEGPVKRDTLYQVYLEVISAQAGMETRKDFLLLMDKLENDFYIRPVNDGYQFFNPVLKTWWQTKYGWHQ